jgi:recyclin-1
MGYALADEFANYMEHTLQNCKVQIEVVSKVFVPDVNAMTLFMDKVIEDSISEYLSAVVGTAKAKEGLLIYLHTLATSMFCCSQLINHICKNQFKVVVDKEQLKAKINEIFSPYLSNYVELELEHLKKKFKIEIDKWDHRVEFKV